MLAFCCKLTAELFIVWLTDTEEVDHEELGRNCFAQEVWTRFPRVDLWLSHTPYTALFASTAGEVVARFVAKPCAVKEVALAPLLDSGISSVNNLLASGWAVVDVRNVAEQQASLDSEHQAFPAAEVATVDAVGAEVDLLVIWAVDD